MPDQEWISEKSKPTGSLRSIERHGISLGISPLHGDPIYFAFFKLKCGCSAVSPFSNWPCSFAVSPFANRFSSFIVNRRMAFNRLKEKARGRQQYLHEGKRIFRLSDLFNNQDFAVSGAIVYEWVQDLDDIVVFIKCPSPNTTKKDLAISIQSNRITLGLKGNPPFLDVSGPARLNKLKLICSNVSPFIHTLLSLTGGDV